ncbi:(2Fe-2S)-binding protein [Sulfurimonas paralvinellae]|uniref:(2Fe-2S)-binding protein n=1 Tax=Sulfurimonas paralvinellae TaxID=317658 RepID=A0A7M1B727_9BACT|nr:(2Fe-2S)-binding protein [Sulfurimonas paralvinellae]
MNIDLDTEICVCNSLTVKDIAECIKKNNLTTLQEVLDNEEMPIGDKCEACHDEGYHNDGLNIPLVLAMVKNGRL